MASDSARADISEGNVISIDGYSALPTHYQPTPRAEASQFLKYDYPIHNEPSIGDVRPEESPIRISRELQQEHHLEYRQFLDTIDQQFLDANTEHDIPNEAQWKLNLPASVDNPDFKPVFSLRGVASPVHLKLFFSIPHFSYGSSQGDGNGISLATYRKTSGTTDSQGVRQIYVHQTCFEGEIERFIVESTTSAMQNGTSSAGGASTSEDRQSTEAQLKTQAKLKTQAQLNTLLADMSTILHLIDSQISVIEKLYEIARGCFWDPYDPCYNRNVIRLLASPLHKEVTLRLISEAFETVLLERKTYAEKFKSLKNNGRKTLRLLVHLMSEGASESQAKQAQMHADAMIQEAQIANERAAAMIAAMNQAKRHAETLEEQGRNAERQAHRANEQARMLGQTMSLFTIVTTIFLPITFLAGYYALEPGKGYVQTYGQFWKTAGPTTVVFTLFVGGVVYRKKYESGEDTMVWGWIKRLWDWIKMLWGWMRAFTSPAEQLGTLLTAQQRRRGR
ncbi:hypothetical protein BDD12DRAFT_803442 [Trichophaea hybrida]|nr:hypothetical protein BDD12DRAFT_803442 [Trichophaea hybrida]